MKKIFVAITAIVLAFGSFGFTSHNTAKKASCCDGGSCCHQGSACCESK